MQHKTERTVSELSSLMRMLQVLPETDSIGKIYLLLLAFCTTWRTFGFRRAYLLLVDPQQNVVKGHIAAERIPLDDEIDGHEPQGNASFEAMAKKVFENYEQIESSDLTLRTRTFSVPIDWYRSAIVKAVGSEFPVLAEGRASEFSTDPFLDFFGTGTYVAIPIKIRGRVTAILAADNGASNEKIAVEDISLVFSLAQHAANAVERLLESADYKRKSRVLRKLQEILRVSAESSKGNESLNLALSMACRACGGSGIFLKDYVHQKTFHIKAVDEYTVEAGDSDLSVGDCFETILDRSAGLMKPVRGDSTHALLNEVASESIRYFFACPLVIAGEGHGALGVYVEKSQINRKHDRFLIKDKVFIELCAGLIADRLHSAQTADRLRRCENLLEELRANLTREQETARVGARAVDHYNTLAGEVQSLRELVHSRGTYQKRIQQAKVILDELESEQAVRQRELATMKFSLKITDLFEVVGQVVEEWKQGSSVDGVEITSRIPKRGPSLLMNEKKVKLALGNILRTLTSCVRDGDKVMVECSTNATRAMVAIADTGAGLPGNLLSRLFMPFSDLDQNDEFKSAMSLAGDIFHHHAGEIMIKSSTSWKTILVVSFPLVANKDRRTTRSERRNRRDRRTFPKGKEKQNQSK